MKHNYPSTRKPTGPRPTAGRKRELIDQVVITVRLEREDRDWITNRYGTVTDGIRQMILDVMGSDLYKYGE